MKFVRKLIALLTALLMLATITFAEETRNVSFKAAIEDSSVSVVETELTGEVDNSNLQVKVIRQVGEQSTIIYTGILGGYDNGAWANIDFGSIDFLVIFNWDNSDDESCRHNTYQR